MRIDKYIADNTDYSRTDAKSFVRRGAVKINDKHAKTASEKVNDNDIVFLFGEPLVTLGNRYFVLNKPTAMICSTEDEIYPSVLNLIEEPQKQKLRIAGRLDQDTTGLVLISDDGDFIHRVTSPKYHCSKAYRATLAEPFTNEMQVQLETGVLLKGEDKPTKPAEVEVLSDTEILLTIAEGRYHQVKRMLAAVGNKVIELHREKVGTVSLEGLEEGHYRVLSDEELVQFKAD